MSESDSSVNFNGEMSEIGAGDADKSSKSDVKSGVDERVFENGVEFRGVPIGERVQLTRG